MTRVLRRSRPPLDGRTWQATRKNISGALDGLKPGDVTSMIFAVATLIVAAALGGLVPARRASRIGPMTAIRYKEVW